MSALQQKKLAQQVAETRSLPDNKRCFNCETLGTTYYVPQFTVFVCTQCSGIHMQFGHRVKSVTLAEYKADEVEQMRQGGNQVAAYRYLARYTPDKDLRKPVDRNPQRIRTWIQTVFVDKRYFSADAPIPRRSTDSATASVPSAAAHSAGGAASGLTPSSSLKRSGSTREGSAATSPLPSPAAAAGAVGRPLPEPGSPPVRDMRELLGEKATSLHVGPKLSTDSTASSSRAASGAGTAPPAAKPAAATASQPAFAPFAVPETAISTPAMPALRAIPVPPASAGTAAASFDPFSQPAAAPVAVPAAAPAVVAPATTSGWAAFSEPPAFGAPAAAPAPAPAAAAVPATPAPEAAAAATDGAWATFGDGAFAAPQAAAVPAPAAPAAAAPAPAAASVASAGAAAAAPPGSESSKSAGTSVAATSSPATPTGSSKGGKPPAKELAADLFADFVYTPQPAALLPQQPGPMQFQQPLQQQMPHGAGIGQPGFGLQQQALQQPHQAWAVQQQSAMLWQQQQLQQQQQQQQAAAYGGMYGGVPPRPGYGMSAAQQPGGTGVLYGMNGVAAGGAGIYGMQQPQHHMQHPQPSSGPASSGSAATWSVTSAAAGVTEESAFADLVDLKKSLPPASSGPQAAAGFPAAQPMMAAQQHLPYAMPAAPAIAGMPGYGAAVPGMLGGYAAPGMAPGFGQAPVVQQQTSFGSSWAMPLSPTGAPAAAQRASDSGNPFA